MAPATSDARWTRVGVSTSRTPAAARSAIRLLDRALGDGLLDPRDDLVEHVVERRGGLEAEHLAGFGDVGNPLLHVVLEALVVREPQGDVRTLDLAPDHFGQLGDAVTLGGRDVEVVVQRCRVVKGR